MALEAGSKLYEHAIDKFAPFSLEEEFETEVQRYRDGTEQRIAHRSEPRKRIRFDTRVKADCYRAVQRDIYAHQRDPWTVRDRSRAIFSVSQMAALGSTISVQTAPSWLADGETVILRDKARIETRVVDNVAAGVVTFTDANDATAWPIGTEISPALPGRMVSPVTGERRVGEEFSFNAQFAITPGLELARTTPAAPASFGGYELFTQAPRRVLPSQGNFVSDLEVVDWGRGRVAFNEPVDFPTEIAELDYGWRDADCIVEIQDLFYRSLGRRGAFYMPTFQKDFRPVGTSSGGNNTLTVAGDFATEFGSSSVFKAVAIQFADGAWQAAAVSSLSPSGANTDISLGSNLDEDVSASSVRRISWLLLRRFASDRLSTDWRYGYGRTSIGVQSLEVPE